MQVTLLNTLIAPETAQNGGAQGLAQEGPGVAGEFQGLLENAKKGGDAELLGLLSQAQNEEMNPHVQAGQLDSQQLMAAVKSPRPQEAVLAEPKVSPEIKEALIQSQTEQKTIGQLLEGNFQQKGTPVLPTEQEIATKMPRPLLTERNSFFPNAKNADPNASAENAFLQKLQLQTRANIPKGIETQPRPTLQSGQDFIKNMAMVDRQHMAVVGENGPQVIKLSPQLNKYNKSVESLSDQIIRPRMQVQEKEALSNNPVFSKSETGLQMNDAHQPFVQEIPSVGMEAEVTVEGQPAKVVDLSNISAKNNHDLIQKVSNYIEQAHVENAKTVDVIVKHDDLGHFQIKATKDVDNQVQLKIISATDKGHDFFRQHEVELIRKLDSSGIKLSDIKIISSNEPAGIFAKGESNMSGDFSGSERHNGSNLNYNQQRDPSQNQDSQRRRQLWEQYREHSQFA